MKKWLVFALCCIFVLQLGSAVWAEDSSGNAACIIYVSAQRGSDSGNGTKQSPFYSVKRAQEEARSYIENMQGDVIVELEGGTYFQTETLCFDERDSGRNGFRVIYRSAEGENAVISGGKIVENWTQGENGAWVASVDGPENIREFYVNGKKQRLASVDNKTPGQGYYIDPAQPGVQKGILLSKELLDGIEHPEDMVFRWSSAWMCYALLCEGIVEVNQEQSAAILQTDFQELSSREANPIRATAGMIIENALKFMNQPGEFYYDKHEKLLYYIPEEGVDMTSCEAIVPVLEKIVSVSGSDSQHLVSNLDFYNLTFSHGAWNLPVEYGYNPVQAQWIYTQDYEIDFTPSNVTVSFADGIGFYGNIFTGLGCVGLGLNEMVSNAKIVGNAFYDIKDSAISVGLLTHDYIAQPEEFLDVAREKPVTATSFSKRKYRPEQAVSPLSNEIAWQPASTDNEPWIQVDLGEEILIGGASLLFQEGGTSGGKVLVSNDENFQTYETLSADKTQTEKFKTSFAIEERTGTCYTYSGNSNQKYRYARIYVQPGSMLNELKIYDREKPGIMLEGVCSNNLISNNYITRVSDYFWSSPGITAYYVDHLEISNNHLENLPYTGISLGWGWIYNTDSTTCHDNLIQANFLKNIMTECYDGGGIYTLGQQPGTKITQNYIRGCHFPYGTLYLDGGSSGIQVTENVTEDTIAYFMNNPADGSNEVFDNYVTNSSTEVFNPSTVVKDAVEFPNGMPTAKIKTIMNRSGLQKDYRYLLDKVPDASDSYAMFGTEGYINMTDAGGVNSIKTYLLEDEIIAGNIALNQIKIGDDLWEYSAEAADEFQTAIFRAQGKMGEVNPGTPAELYQEWENLRSAYQKLLDSRNQISYEELLARSKNALALAQTGSGQGQYSQEAIDEFAEFLANDISYVKNDDPYLHLEQAYMAFTEQRQTLSILGVEHNLLVGEPVIDQLNSKITVFVSPTADLTRIVPNFILSKGAKLSDQTANCTDFSRPVTLVVKNEEETAYRFWTVEFRKKALSSFGK